MYTIGDRMFFDDYLDSTICKECERELPDEKYITKNGCLWCDPFPKKLNDKDKKRLKEVMNNGHYMGKESLERCKEIVTENLFQKYTKDK